MKRLFLMLIHRQNCQSSEHFKLTAIDENTIELELAKEDSLNHVFEALSKQNIRVNSLRNKSNRLEELFLELVEKGVIDAE